jgi:hypothetical protein
MTNNDQTATDGAPVRFRASPDAVAQRLGDEMVLIHLKTDRIFVLNRTAARLWELLSRGLERADIQRQMLEEFDVTEDQLASEVDPLVTSLKNEHLIAPA